MTGGADMEVFFLMFSAMLCDNFVLTKLFGIESLFANSSKPSTALINGISVWLLTLFSGAVSYALYSFVLIPLGIGYFAIIISVLVISACTVLAGKLGSAVSAKLGRRVAAHMPMVTTNCVVLGSVMLACEKSLSYGKAVALFFAAGLGFAIAISVFASVREKMEFSECPACFRGIPILLVAAALCALAFSGFAGVSFGA